ncbi:MAG TPA: right-handed parallel beta-helix repeat-containing protein [Anaerolineae bacterium]|nr:right-handed parallel beta-helix repeat-containing protein [Anaerolineae bacterium]HQI85802.1 right-handed parallel beta-helix repeat-containing protein [Anaerolineae bacterium]
MRQDIVPGFHHRLSKIQAAITLGLSLLLFWLPSERLQGSAGKLGTPVSSGGVVLLVCLAGPPVCDYQTIQAAVDQVGNNGLIKVAAGMYSGVNTYGGLSQVVYISKSLTIRGGYLPDFAEPPDPDAHPTTIDAAGKGRGVYLTGNISVTLENLRITGGDAAGLKGGGYYSDNYDGGGGIYAITGTLMLSHSQLVTNVAGVGGGLYLQYGAAWLNDNLIAANRAITWGGGGGLGFYESNITLNGNLISNNYAERGSGGGTFIGGQAIFDSNSIISNVDGGLYLWDTAASFVGNQIISNTGEYGGGLRMVYNDEALFSHNLIAHNSAYHGGGLYLQNSNGITLANNVIISNTAFSAGGLVLNGCSGVLSANLISDNRAYWHGAGVVMAYSQAVLQNNTVTTNHADLDGGGVFLEASRVTLENNTIADNTANRGGGLLIYTTTATLTNNIIADNHANSAGSGVSIWAAQVAFLHNTLANNRGAGGGVYVSTYVTSWGEPWYSTVTLTSTILSGHQTGLTVLPGNQVSTAGTLWFANDQDGEGVFSQQDDYLGSPDFVAAERGDYHLRETSAAIDLGQPVGVADDIDGEARPWGPAPDVGADEFYPYPGLSVSKQASTEIIAAGERLTYTLYVINTGNVTLHTSITDTLPTAIESGYMLTGSVIMPGGTLWWIPLIGVGEAWTQTVVVTVTPGYQGPLANEIEVTTQEGVAGAYTNTVVVISPRLYLPLVMK